MIDNTVIKAETPKMGAEIVKYFQSLGVDSEGFVGNSIRHKYYGVVNRQFNCFSISELETKYPNVKIIKLPTMNEYPKVMMVSNNIFDKENTGHQRVVFMEKKGKYLAWVSAETIEDSEIETGVDYWNYAEDIKPIPEYTMEELIKLIGHDFKLKPQA